MVRKINEFTKFCNVINRYIEKIQEYPVKVLYGFKWNEGGGVFVDILLKSVYNVDVDYLIDDDEFFYRFPVYKGNLLDYLDCEETVIIDATGVEGKEKELLSLGYRKGINYFNICELYNLNIVGYIEYLEKKYNLDISNRNTDINVTKISEDYVKYGPSRSMSMPILCDYLVNAYGDKKVLDLGCGKAGAMIVFRDFGYKVVDGVEYLDELASIARKNLKKFDNGANSKVYHKNVLEFDGYDNYDLVYIYDAFRGNTFSRVKDLLVESEKRNPRKMVVVYANPFEHKIMVSGGQFRMVKQLEGDWFTRLVNIYEYVGNSKVI